MKDLKARMGRSNEGDDSTDKEQTRALTRGQRMGCEFDPLLGDDFTADSSKETGDRGGWTNVLGCTAPSMIVNDGRLTLPPKVTPNLFRGEGDAAQWIKRFEGYAWLSSWADDSTKEVFPMFLEGPSLTWYESLASGDTMS